MKQEIFDKTATHLLRQGTTEYYGRGGMKMGRFPEPPYRASGDQDSDGNICKECALTFMVGITGKGNIICRDDKEMAEYPIAFPLFICHDYVPQERWPGFMRGIARFFGLSELSIDIWEAEQAPDTDSASIEGSPVDLRGEDYVRY